MNQPRTIRSNENISDIVSVLNDNFQNIYMFLNRLNNDKKAEDSYKLNGKSADYYAPIAHSVTPGYVPYAKTATMWYKSPLYVDAGNIGIGTIVPSRLLDLGGSTTPYMAFTPSATNSQFVIGSDLYGFVIYDDTNNDYRAAFGKTRYSGLSIGRNYCSTSAPVDGLIIEGKVGVGVTVPITDVDIRGNIGVYNEINECVTNANAAIYINHSGYNGGTTQFRDLYVQNGKGTTLIFVDGSASTIGLGGVTNPSATLDILGGVNISIGNTYKVDGISLTYTHVNADPAGAAAAVQSGLDTHIGLTGSSVHGLGTASTHAHTEYETAGAAAAAVSGTSGYISKFTSAHAVANSIIYDDGSGVAIGSTDPIGYKLFVGGNQYVNGAVIMVGGLACGSSFGAGILDPNYHVHIYNTSTAATTLGLQNDSTGGKIWEFKSIGSAGTGRVGNLSLRNDTDSLDVIEITPAGNVGIGTTNPGFLLHVNGASNLVGNVSIGQYSQALIPDITLSSGARTLRFNNSTSAQDEGFEFYNSDAPKTLLTILQSGNVGIGITAPSRPLDLGGSTTPYMAFTPSATNSQFVIGSDLYGFVIYDDTNNDYRAAFGKTRYSGLSIGHTYCSTAAPVDGLIVEGKVGIGTTDPDTLVHMSGSVPELRLTDSNFDIYGYIRLNPGTGSMIVNSPVSLSLEPATDYDVVLGATGNGRVNIYAPVDSNSFTADGRMKIKLNDSEVWIPYETP